MKPSNEQVFQWVEELDIEIFSSGNAVQGMSTHCLKQFAALAYAAGAAAMKERAAKVCESLFDAEDDSCDEAEKCAEAIRELGDDDD